MKILKTNKYRAFSLIELMMVIAIIGVMSAVAYVSLTSSRSAARLKTAQREVAATIRLAQGYAIQGKTQNGVTPCGYGVRFLNDRIGYRIYYNIAVPGVAGYETCEQRNLNANGKIYTNAAQIASMDAESFSLKDGITLSSNVNNAQIYFTVPHAYRFDWQGNPYDTQASNQRTLRLFDAIANKNKTIEIRPGGYLTESP